MYHCNITKKSMKRLHRMPIKFFEMVVPQFQLIQEYRAFEYSSAFLIIIKVALIVIVNWKLLK